MPEPTIAIAPADALAELAERLGSIPLERIRLHPAPGTATEADLLAQDDGTRPICELVEGVLVEKAMGYYESRLATLLVYFLESYLEKHDLGIVLGEAGTVRLNPGLVRVPDVSFVSWRWFPDRLLPAEPIPDLAPDLAIEVLSPSNTKREMNRKLQEYFRAGSRLVWYFEPRDRTVRVYTSPDSSQLLTEADTLDGGDVLPGFTLPLRRLFGRAGRRRNEE